MSSAPAFIYQIEETMFAATSDGTRSCSGWIFCQGTTHCVAVRARGAGQTVLGLLGLPRPDVAAAYPDEAQAVFSGFQMDLSCLNHQPIRLEWMDDTERWHEFWREPVAYGSKLTEPFASPLLPTSFLPALHATTAEETAGLTWREAWERTGELVAECTSHPAPEPTSTELFVNLDQPHGEFFSGKLLQVKGWIFSRHRPIRRIFAHVEPGGLVHLIFPKPRPDVAATYLTPPAPVKCGFEGMTLLPGPLAPASLYFRLYAEFSDGSVALAVSRRFFRDPQSAESAGRARSALLLGALALADAYQLQSWPHWLQTLLARRRVAAPAPSPVKSRMVSGPRKGAPAATPAIEPRESDPLISIIVPVFNTPERYLREMIASVQAQSYPRWELCLADDASTEPHVRRLLAEFARADSRIRPVYRSENGHISRASNSALAHAQGEFVALLDHDDLLAAEVLRRVVEAIHARPRARFFYTNRDKIDDQGRHFDPENRGAWNPAAAITHNYLHHLTVIRRSLVLEAGAFRPDFFGSQDLDLYLRCHELVQPGQIVYVPCIGYHWRAHAGSTASRGDQKDYMFDSARRAIADALQRRGLRATPFLPDFGPIYGMNLHQLRWDPAILRENPVSIVIAVPPEQRHLWPLCLNRLIATVPVGCAQIIVVSAGALAITPPTAKNLKPLFIIASTGTSLARLYNLGAEQAQHPRLLLLNAGVTPKTTGWLEDLAGWLSVPSVAAAGPKLIAADGLLASAGWTINPATHLPQPLCAGDPVDDIIPPYLSISARDALLLDPNCILTRTEVFRELGGYESHRFPAQHFAADYCLRLKNLCHRVVFSPQAVFDVAENAGCSSVPAESEDTTFQLLHPGGSDPWVQPADSCQRLPATDQAEAGSHQWMPADTVEFSDGWFFLEQPYPGEEIHAGHQMLSGWCLARSGKSIADLQVGIGEQIHRPNLGHPRPDLAAKTGFTGNFFPVGFNLELGLPPGPVRLEFAAFVTAKGWQPVCTVDLDVLPRYAPTRPASAAKFTVKQFADAAELLVKQSMAAPTVNLARLAGPFARHAAMFITRRNAAKPFYGFIDNPTPNFVPIYGGVIVSGWLFHEGQPIRRVAASYDLTQWLELHHDKTSPDISARFPHVSFAARCGIFGFITVPQNQLQPQTLRIWAELADGSWHLIFTLRSQLHALGASDLSLLQGVSTWCLLRISWTLQLAFSRWHARGPGWLVLWSVVSELRRRLPSPVNVKKIPAPKLTPIRAAVPHLLIVSHNLNREGAPLFLLELARYCRQHTAAIRLTVVSPLDGSLREEFEHLGAEVRLVDRAPLWTARTPTEAGNALDVLARELQAHEASLVVANTIESFWAVQIAEHAGRPSLFYIHEPGVLGFHYLNQLSSHLRRAAVTALARATCVSFTNRATQSYYLAYSAGANYRIQPGWSDLSSRATIPSASARNQLRARLGFAPHERVVINVGTICQRKGQLFFVYAVEHLWRTQPALAASCRFLLIGENDNRYGTTLAALIARLGRPNLQLVPPTNRVYDYFGAADLFVLSSFEEGFSRVLLEAMGFGLPIVSTAIHGIPELVRQGREALLVPAGDAPAMAAAMRQLLQDEVTAARLGHNARERLQASYTATRVLPLHLATLKELVPDLKAFAPKIPAPGSREPTRAVV